MTRRRVVVTGMGIVSPVGSDLKTAWDNILAGKSGVRTITDYDVSGFPTRFAGLVQGFDATKWMGPKEVRRNDPFIHYGLGAAKMAVLDAGLEITDANRERIGVTIGSGIGGIGTIAEQCVVLHESGVKKVSLSSSPDRSSTWFLAPYPSNSASMGRALAWFRRAPRLPTPLASHTG